MTDVMGYESFSSQVGDDGSPNRAAEIAGQAIRDFNHRTINANGHLGWNYPADAYRVLGELCSMAGGLPQAFDQVARFLTRLNHDELVVMDAGGPFEGNTGAAIEMACQELTAARQHAHNLYAALAAAQAAISRASYNGGPDVDED